MGSARTCTATILALILPPVAVALQCGCGCQLFINILLTLLGFLPGMIHALFVICMADDLDGRRGDELPVAHTQPAASPTQQQYAPQYPQGAQPAMVTGQPVAAHPGHYPPVPPPAPTGYVPPPVAGYAPPPAGYPTKV
ncbi:hypothetical protein OEZ85_006802 [Tetradesmus obliquus]|uniref:Uncharacterized protein n=1 Tax=Tetradesmus obliquus TaxID=3088 RepID=A0ABY8TVS7_TETOB|nr:hypothetical protein OEZ85_006802 [Tetradesmus obliquus]